MISLRKRKAENSHNGILKSIKAVNTSSFSLETLKNVSQRLRATLNSGAQMDILIVEAFAAVNEAIYRVFGYRAFDVQILAGIALNEGSLIEMNTGEGKTLAAVFPAYLNALSGKGVHVLTVNDYLARRDA